MRERPHHLRTVCGRIRCIVNMAPHPFPPPPLLIVLATAIPQGTKTTTPRLLLIRVCLRHLIVTWGFRLVQHLLMVCTLHLLMVATQRLLLACTLLLRIAPTPRLVGARNGKTPCSKKARHLVARCTAPIPLHVTTTTTAHQSINISITIVIIMMWTGTPRREPG